MSGTDILISIGCALMYSIMATAVLIATVKEEKQKKKANAELKRANDLYEKNLKMIEEARKRGNSDD